ncbi:hypothetical protein BJ508DRAFT_331620 [Ascobolus immersus RN42]|uniref:F-box domain-containing protein n=1 Tax=Ascobolus immersus RN42 TaxID=1160509 RepID=A0A3N4HQ15_ASCIM|nr:hypothetical protein BJ508DRAFT_331620 [Ascobolus immersus RN42]
MATESPSTIPDISGYPRLPNEILIQIILYLPDANAFLNVSQVSRNFRELTIDKATRRSFVDNWFFTYCHPSSKTGIIQFIARLVRLTAHRHLNHPRGGFSAYTFFSRELKQQEISNFKAFYVLSGALSWSKTRKQAHLKRLRSTSPEVAWEGSLFERPTSRPTSVPVNMNGEFVMQQVAAFHYALGLLNFLPHYGKVIQHAESVELGIEDVVLASALYNVLVFPPGPKYVSSGIRSNGPMQHSNVETWRKVHPNVGLFFKAWRECEKDARRTNHRECKEYGPGMVILYDWAY